MVRNLILLLIAYLRFNYFSSFVLIINLLSVDVFTTVFWPIHSMTFSGVQKGKRETFFFFLNDTRMVANLPSRFVCSSNVRYMYNTFHHL